MTKDQERDEQVIRSFILRYAAKETDFARHMYLSRFKELSEELGYNVPLVQKDSLDRIYALLKESMEQTDKCLAMLGAVDVLTEAQANEIISPTNQAQ